MLLFIVLVLIAYLTGCQTTNSNLSTDLNNYNVNSFRFFRQQTITFPDAFVFGIIIISQ
jgi:hypothetical protein